MRGRQSRPREKLASEGPLYVSVSGVQASLKTQGAAVSLVVGSPSVSNDALVSPRSADMSM